MFIYTMSFNDYNGVIRIDKDIVVKETDKLYIMADNSRVYKKALNVISATSLGVGYRMKTLEPNVAEYKAKVREVMLQRYESAIKEADRVKNNISKLDTCDKVRYVED